MTKLQNLIRRNLPQYGKVEFITVHYEGYGGDKEITYSSFQDKERKDVSIPENIIDMITEDLFGRVDNFIGDGWEHEEGGIGIFTIIVSHNTIDHHHDERYIEIEARNRMGLIDE